MHANDITVWGMAAAYATVLVSLLLFRVARVKLEKEFILSLARMTVQLGLVGLYLTAIFELNNPFLNLGYVLLMVGVANYSLLRNSGLKLVFFGFTFGALAFSMGGVLLYFLVFVFSPTPLFDARYVIPVAGMLLGNSMSRTIVTLERFYSSIRGDLDGYYSSITVGATVREASEPYLTIAYRAGLQPSLANMATIGLVSLPGMMTGQILGGSSPLVAIKYQIAIIIAIFVATELATLLSIFSSMRKGFDEFGFLRSTVFKNR